MVSVVLRRFCLFLLFFSSTNSSTMSLSSSALAAIAELSRQSTNHNHLNEFSVRQKLQPLQRDTSGKVINPNNKKRKMDDDHESEEAKSDNKDKAKVKGLGLTAEQLAEIDATMNSVSGKRELTDKQISGIKSLLQGNNVFFVGGPGVGKSHCLSKARQILNDYGIENELLSTTVDGAIYLGCPTIDAWMNVPSICLDDDKLLEITRADDPDKWKKLRVLLIDNVGQVDFEYFVKMHKLACAIKRQVNKGFGGYVLAFSADLAMPPTTKSFTEHRPPFFEYTFWKKLNFVNCYLEQNFRHTYNPAFSSFLDRIRLGRTNDDDLAFCEKLVIRGPRGGKLKFQRPTYRELKDQTFAYSPVNFTPIFVPPVLHYLSGTCDVDNTKMLKRLQPKPECIVTFKAREIVGNETDRIVKEKIARWFGMMRASNIKECIELCTGCQVILQRDIPMPVAAATTASASLSTSSLSLTDPPNNAKVLPTIISQGTVGIITAWSEIFSDLHNSMMKMPVIEWLIRDSLGEELARVKTILKYERCPNLETGATYAQLPISLGWAVTVQDNSELLVDTLHMLTDKLIFDARQFFASIKAVKYPSQFTAEGFSADLLEVNSKVVDKYRELEKENELAESAIFPVTSTISDSTSTSIPIPDSATTTTAIVDSSV